MCRTGRFSPRATARARRESLWLWPAVAALAAWVAGDLAARSLHSFTLHQGLFPTDLDDARTLLATIATALLTFTGVVLHHPRRAPDGQHAVLTWVFRTFVRKPVTKLTLSTFIATFVFRRAAGPGRHDDESAHRPPGRGRSGVSARDGVGYRLRRLRARDGVFHAGHLRARVRLPRTLPAMLGRSRRRITTKRRSNRSSACPQQALRSTTPTLPSTASTPSAWSTSHVAMIACWRSVFGSAPMCIAGKG